MQRRKPMRLIDADALFQDLKEHNIPFNANINEAIIVAPTIDAVPVVRCKDCVYCRPFSRFLDGEYTNMECYYWDFDGLRDNDFCSCGERKDEE